MTEHHHRRHLGGGEHDEENEDARLERIRARHPHAFPVRWCCSKKVDKKN